MYNYSYYNSISKYHIDISEEEEIQLFDAYKHCREAVELEIFKHSSSVEKLLEIYTDLVRDGRSIAKLSRDFNTNKPGHNANIIEVYKKNIPKYAVSPKNRAINLASLRFSRSLYTTLYKNLEDENTNIKLIKILKFTMEDIADKMVRSCLKAAHDIAGKYTVFGISFSDLVQEACLGFHDSVDLYNPDYKTIEGDRVKFITYAYLRAERRVKEWIMNQSREIRLPRSRLEIIFVIIEAARSLEEGVSEEEFAEEVNLLLKKRKKKAISLDEIQAAITLLRGNTVSMDAPVNWKTGEDKPQTLSDLIIDNKRSPEEDSLFKEDRKFLIKAIGDVLDPLGYQIIYYRYFSGHNKVRSLEDTASKLFQNGVTERELSREAIRNKEKIALKEIANEAPYLEEFLKKSTFSES